MTTAKLLERQPRLGLKLQLELSSLKAQADTVAAILCRKASSTSSKARAFRPVSLADVPVLMDELFPRRPRHPTMYSHWPDYRNDVVDDLRRRLVGLIGDRWHLLSPDRRCRLFTRPRHWWADPARPFHQEHDPVSYEMWSRIERGRASVEDAMVVVAAAISILQICAEVIAMHYEAASDPPLELSTWKPWKAPKAPHALIALHA